MSTQFVRQRGSLVQVQFPDLVCSMSLNSGGNIRNDSLGSSCTGYSSISWEYMNNDSDGRMLELYQWAFTLRKEKGFQKVLRSKAFESTVLYGGTIHD